MGAIFQSLGRTITAGVVLLVIFIIIAGLGTGSGCARAITPGGRSSSAGCTCCSGVMWIGLLWYFNFVQTPSMPKIPGRAEAGDQQGDRADRAVLVPLGARWRPSSPA